MHVERCMTQGKKIREPAKKKTVADYERDRRQILKMVPKLRKIKKGCS
jgi:hypothetical protein